MRMPSGATQIPVEQNSPEFHQNSPEFNSGEQKLNLKMNEKNRKK